ncbi:MAG TPA: hypothetical protein VKO18_04180 [Terriglobia bacterium]|nr:hypothetical protein [Terriglobia bacterium]
MTKLLEKVFTEASKLPQQEQDLLARQLLADIASESRWSEAFANSQDQLGKLADEALAEFEAGRKSGRIGLEYDRGSDQSRH